MQASVVTTILLGLLILPSLIIVMIPLMDKILNSSFIGYFHDSLTSLDILLGSNTVNYLLIILGLIMFLVIFRFFLRSISVLK